MEGIQKIENKEHNGIELIFPERPNRDMINQLKERGFRWHAKRQLWYAKMTEERDAFATRIVGESQPEKAQAEAKEVAEKIKRGETREGNSFAAHYDKIGDTGIYETGDFAISEITEGYIRDLNVFYRRTWGGDCILITDLEGAGKPGAECRTWNFNPPPGSNICMQFLDKENIRTVSELVKALKEGHEFQYVTTYERRQKGIDVFSPFIEAKPLKKTPTKWNKRNFTQALLSGQIYRGTLDEHLTDDYAMDAANNFGSGTPLSIPAAARRAVEDWSSLDYVYPEKEPSKDGTIQLNFSSVSTMKTFLFDINCDIKESKRREDERQAGIKSYNDMLKSSCIQLKPERIDPNKVYLLQTLDTGTNSGVYAVKSETIQGHVLIDRLDPPYMDVVSLNEFEIQPEKVYAVSNFYDRLPPSREEDSRIIHCGNWKEIVTGKALLELTGEGIYFPRIAEEKEYGPTCEKAIASLQRFESGQLRWGVGQKGINYTREINKLKGEMQRLASCKPALDNLISSASGRTVQSKGQHQVSFERG